MSSSCWWLGKEAAGKGVASLVAGGGAAVIAVVMGTAAGTGVGAFGKGYGLGTLLLLVRRLVMAGKAAGVIPPSPPENPANRGCLQQLAFLRQDRRSLRPKQRRLGGPAHLPPIPLA